MNVGERAMRFQKERRGEKGAGEGEDDDPDTVFCLTVRSKNRSVYALKGVDVCVGRSEERGKATEGGRGDRRGDQSAVRDRQLGRLERKHMRARAGT